MENLRLDNIAANIKEIGKYIPQGAPSGLADQVHDLSWRFENLYRRQGLPPAYRQRLTENALEDLNYLLTFQTLTDNFKINRVDTAVAGFRAKNSLTARVAQQRLDRIEKLTVSLSYGIQTQRI